MRVRAQENQGRSVDWGQPGHAAGVEILDVTVL